MSAPTLAERAAGVLLGAACGDALGVPYEGHFDVPPTPVMIGGGLGPYRPGEWSDDTQMTWCVAQVAAAGDLLSRLDVVAGAFVRWARHGASDIGALTAAVLRGARRRGGQGWAAALTREALALHEASGRTAGNGSLMRTSPVALAYLRSPRRLSVAARAVSDLTHADPLAADACLIWCHLIRAAILDPGGDLHLAADGALAEVPELRRGQWRRWLGEARANPPEAFSGNGYVVVALQAAYSAATAADDFGEGLIAAVRAGGDTDTVASIAGALLGARFGAPAIPAAWVAAVHGWPGRDGRDLVALAERLITEPSEQIPMTTTEEEKWA